MLDQKEVTQIFEDFLNENGLWPRFENDIKEKGYTLEELGMTSDE